MKTPSILITTLLLLASAAMADSPAQIAADYRKAADTALSKVNATLEKATVPLVASLVKTGDTAGAEELQSQLKAKIAGEPVAKPQASAIVLFKSYDVARAKAIEPAQKAAVARIDLMLASSEGKKLDVVSSLGKVREEVEGGKVDAASLEESLPVKWSYHMKPDIGPSGTMIFNPKGDIELWITGRKNATYGTWKKAKIAGQYTISMGGDTFTMIVTGTTAEMDMPQVGKRYLKAVAQASN